MDRETPIFFAFLCRVVKGPFLEIFVYKFRANFKIDTQNSLKLKKLSSRSIAMTPNILLGNSKLFICNENSSTFIEAQRTTHYESFPHSNYNYQLFF
jgi:hypothetical protein